MRIFNKNYPIEEAAEKLIKQITIGLRRFIDLYTKPPKEKWQRPFWVYSVACVTIIILAIIYRLTSSYW